MKYALKFLPVSLILVSTFISGCGASQTNQQHKSPAASEACVQKATTSSAPFVSNLSCNFAAKYTLIFTGSWTSTTHPTDFPSNAHFTNLVGLNHNENFNLWSEGLLASPGVRAVAERGDRVPICGEVQNAINSTNAENLLVSNSGISSTGSTAFNFPVSPGYSKLSLVSMLAPSTNWFVGINNLDLCDAITMTWSDTISLDLYPYCAGADSGTTFLSPRVELTPHIPIALLNAPFLNNDSVAPVAHIIISRQ
jgi:hypothetical protein